MLFAGVVGCLLFGDSVVLVDASAHGERAVSGKSSSLATGLGTSSSNMASTPISSSTTLQSGRSSSAVITSTVSTSSTSSSTASVESTSASSTASSAPVPQATIVVQGQEGYTFVGCGQSSGGTPAVINGAFSVEACANACYPAYGQLDYGGPSCTCITEYTTAGSEGITDCEGQANTYPMYYGDNGVDFNYQWVGCTQTLGQIYVGPTPAKDVATCFATCTSQGFYPSQVVYLAATSGTSGDGQCYCPPEQFTYALSNQCQDMSADSDQIGYFVFNISPVRSSEPSPGGNVSMSISSLPLSMSFSASPLSMSVSASPIFSQGTSSEMQPTSASAGSSTTTASSGHPTSTEAGQVASQAVSASPTAQYSPQAADTASAGDTTTITESTPSGQTSTAQPPQPSQASACDCQYLDKKICDLTQRVEMLEAKVCNITQALQRWNGSVTDWNATRLSWDIV